MRSRAVVVAVTLVGATLVAACGTSGGNGTSSSSTATPTSAPTIPTSCPTAPVDVPIDTTPPPPGSQLVPSDATVAYVCVYPGPREGGTATQTPIVVADVQTFIVQLNSSQDATTKSYSCPPDEGGVDIATLEGQPGAAVHVRIPRSGCQHLNSTFTSGIWVMPWEATQYFWTIDPSYAK